MPGSHATPALATVPLETVRCVAMAGRDASGSARNTDPVSSAARPITNSR